MSEMIDIYDQNRHKTGKIVDRKSYLYEKNEYMMYVLALIENQEGKFLLTQRSLNKKWAPGAFEICGGGAMSGESIYEAIVREVKEEVGLDVNDGQVVYTYFNEDPKRKDNYFVDIYHFKLDFKLNDVILHDGETVSYRLSTSEEIKKDSSILHYERILIALQNINYELK